MPKNKATILVDQYEKAAKTQAGKNSYKGLQIHALPGLHQFIATLSVKYFKSNASVLDLAAGSGALSQRLNDNGFSVTATDYVHENFKLESVKFIQADLNENFSEAYAAPFQAIVATEIIEHLENPRHFARECFKLLEQNGRLIFSTPNIESSSSLASFVRTGTFAWFSDQDYEKEGHITPLTHWCLHKSFSEAGFNFLWKGSFGDGLRLANGSPRLRILAKTLNLFSLTPPNLNGEILIFVLEKPSR